MRLAGWIAAAAGACGVVVVACSGGSGGGAKYPACQRDDQCAVNGRHDYCVEGRCAYCRTSVDCGDRERCRAGRCEADPDAPPLPEAGADAEADGGEEAGEDEDESTEEEQNGTHYEQRVRDLERRARQMRMRRRP